MVSAAAVPSSHVNTTSTTSTLCQIVAVVITTVVVPNHPPYEEVNASTETILKQI